MPLSLVAVIANEIRSARLRVEIDGVLVGVRVLTVIGIDWFAQLGDPAVQATAFCLAYPRPEGQVCARKHRLTTKSARALAVTGVDE
jgi:hypothetical protein